MELLRGTESLHPGPRGHALTIGNYDGVHRGHQSVLARLRERAGELGVPAAAMVFEPTPREYFAGEDAPARLTRFREKFIALRETGIERMVCVRFNAGTAAMSPAAFIETLLVNGLGVRYLTVGEDFRFGAKRAGDIATLREAGERHGFEVAIAPTLMLDGERVSSTRVREALAAGELDAAAGLLGRPYRMSGRVITGQQLGRKLGYPTANIGVGRLITPLHGIYAVRARGVPGMPAHWVDGVASLGTRPTVDGTEMLLEVHLFDFAGDLYGCRLDVEFVRFLRKEARFDDLDALVAQMHVDAEHARAALAASPQD